ncbi:MAG TPA: hypothetical protein VFO07_16940, partial [Roseiflexaceae bacterium]|nr:hypothetical protein [Roseiflexaceae bacterium]
MPGESTQDLWEKLWDLWWFSEALWRGVDPFYTDMLFYPQGASLLFHPLSPASALLTLPIQALAGPLAAYNTLVLLSFVLGGYAVFLLAQRHGCGFSAALAGGLVYSAGAFHFNHIHLSHLELISIQWLPLYALALDALLQPTTDHQPPTTDASDSSSFAGRRASVIRVLLTALAMLMLIFTSLYLAMYAALLSGIWILWLIGTALRRRSARSLLRPVAELGLATALALAVTGPI